MKKTILQLLQEYNIETKAEGTLLRAFCPFHDDTGKPNFTVYPTTDSWYCFACNVGGNQVKFISLIEGISYTEANAKFTNETVDASDLRDRLETETEEVQTFNNEVNIQVSHHCRQYMHQYPTKTKVVMEYLKKLDMELKSEISYEKMKDILETVKQTFIISE